MTEVIRKEILNSTSDITENVIQTYMNEHSLIAHKVIACGYFAQIWLVKHLCTGKQAAVKICNKPFTASFLSQVKSSMHLLNELSVHQTLKHANILQLYDWMDSVNWLYLEFEYMSGGNVVFNVNEQGPFNNHEGQRLAKQIAFGLKYFFCVS